MLGIASRILAIVCFNSITPDNGSSWSASCLIVREDSTWPMRNVWLKVSAGVAPKWILTLSRHWRWLSIAEIRASRIASEFGWRTARLNIWFELSTVGGRSSSDETSAKRFNFSIWIAVIWPGNIREEKAKNVEDLQSSPETTLRTSRFNSAKSLCGTSPRPWSSRKRTAASWASKLPSQRNGSSK